MVLQHQKEKTQQSMNPIKFIYKHRGQRRVLPMSNFREGIQTAWRALHGIPVAQEQVIVGEAVRA
jgi:hypothetical protein